MRFTFNSVVFNTGQLNIIRDFYEKKLGFPLSQHENSFEHEHGKSGAETKASEGDLVINVSYFPSYKEKVRTAGVPIARENDRFFMINDPEGRTIIFEPA